MKSKIREYFKEKIRTKSIKLFYIIPFVLLLGSCQDVIQVKLDEGSKLYVIDAFINDLRKDQYVRVTTNDSYFSNRQAPPVTNASVILFDVNTNASYSFSYTTDGRYVFPIYATDTIARLGHRYILQVTIDGTTYTSLNEQHRAAVIDSIASYYNDGSDPFGGPKDTYSCLLFAKDKADNIPDYYWVKTFRNDTLFNGSADINICIDGTGGQVYNAPTDTILFTPSATFLGFKNYQYHDRCKVEIHSISRETYFFFLQALQQINNAGLFATTPENIKSNISSPSNATTRAIGWFSMSSAVTKEKLVE
jgi:hypothetical protein